MQQVQEIIGQVRKVVVGKDTVIASILMAMLAQGHVLLEDVPGVGKTTMALAFSRTMDLSYKRMQFTPDVMPSDITGYTTIQTGGAAGVYVPGAAMCNLFLADEINRASSKTQSALLEVMEENSITVDGITRPVPQPFLVIATQNPRVLPARSLCRSPSWIALWYASRWDTPTAEARWRCCAAIKTRFRSTPSTASFPRRISRICSARWKLSTFPRHCLPTSPS
jgi:MoxR-like ATPase